MGYHGNIPNNVDVQCRESDGIFNGYDHASYH